MEWPVELSGAFASLGSRWPDSPWIADACERARQRLENHPHGDLPRWLAALAALPPVPPRSELDLPAPRLGAAITNCKALRQALMALRPWRKGPLWLGGVHIDSEWRSDWKWRRLAPHVDLRGQRVADVGCGNGYFGLRMLGGGARLVVGIDPTLLYVMQWLACRHFGGDLPNYILPLGVEDLPDGAPGFDTVFSMGVLYHRRDPDRHLRQLRALLRGGGRLVLETLVLPPNQAGELLQPGSRYARMRNVWAIPGTGRLRQWLESAGYRDIECLDQSATTVGEQRSTDWMRFESLSEALDPRDASRTVEGHPAPIRAVVTATV